MKLSCRVKVKNLLGLHMRPVTMIVKLLQNCKSDVYFTYKKQRVNAKSLLNLLILAAKKNADITVEIEGEDSKEFMEKIVESFENGFGELPHHSG